MKRKRRTLSIMLAGAVLFGVSTASHAASWDAGDWKLSLGGNINTFYVYTLCKEGDLKSGGTTLTGLVCAGAVDEKGKPKNTSSVQNGLLPASLNFSASTNQEGWDISSNISVYYGVTSVGTNGNSGGADALKFSTVDARQVFFTVGKGNIGTFKLGRDFGLFAFDAIINDMSLLGVGAQFVASDPGHTSLGGLGYGYVYTDRLAQINYTTPDMGGFKATIGVFNPLDGNGADSAGTSGFHGKVAYGWKAPAGGTPISVTLSATGLTEEVNNSAAGKKGHISGFDVFGKVNVAALSLLGYYYGAKGMDTLAIGGLVFPGFDNTAGGRTEKLDGYMVQATYTISKFRLGANWSFSEQKEITKIENQKLGLGVFYNLTPALTLVAEYSDQESKIKSAGGGKDKTQNINVGGILFF